MGSGDINLKGNATKQKIRISGSGDYDGVKLKSWEVDATVRGSGDITVWVEDKLECKISGAGSVKYKGNPKLNVATWGAGRIEQIE